MKIGSYKFRAECFGDVARWFVTLTQPGCFIEPSVTPAGDGLGSVCSFSSALTLDQLRTSMKAARDCHVMAETLAHLPLNTRAIAGRTKTPFLPLILSP